MICSGTRTNMLNCDNNVYTIQSNDTPLEMLQGRLRTVLYEPAKAFFLHTLPTGGRFNNTHMPLVLYVCTHAHLHCTVTPRCLYDTVVHHSYLLPIAYCPVCLA